MPDSRFVPSSWRPKRHGDAVPPCFMKPHMSEEVAQQGRDLIKKFIPMRVWPAEDIARSSRSRQPERPMSPVSSCRGVRLILECGPPVYRCSRVNVESSASPC